MNVDVRVRRELRVRPKIAHLVQRHMEEAQYSGLQGFIILTLILI